jgi:hypothetical protein
MQSFRRISTVDAACLNNDQDSSSSSCCPVEAIMEIRDIPSTPIEVPEKHKQNNSKASIDGAGISYESNLPKEVPYCAGNLPKEVPYFAGNLPEKVPEKHEHSRVHVLLTGSSMVLPEANVRNGMRPDEKHDEGTMILPKNYLDKPYNVNISIETGTLVDIAGSIFLLGANKFCLDQGKTTLPVGTLFTWTNGRGLLEDIQRIQQPVTLQRNCNIKIPASTLVYLNNIEFQLLKETNAMII